MAGALSPDAAGSRWPFYDSYFRAFDQAYPDVWRFNEWDREFQQFVRQRQSPTLEMIRGLDQDLTGSFAQALGGVNTPELQGRQRLCSGPAGPGRGQ